MNAIRKNSIPEVSVSYRSRKAMNQLVITCPDIAFKAFMSAWDSDKLELLEQFNVLLLDRKNSILGFTNISTGGVSRVVVDPKIVFIVALKTNASAIIIAHNHPSGNLDISDADINLTRRLKKAGEFLEIEILDHLIVTRTQYVSFAAEGIL